MKESIYKIVLIASILLNGYINIFSAPPEFIISSLNNPAPGVLNFSGGAVENFRLVDNYGYDISNDNFNKGSQQNQFLSNGLWISLVNSKYYLYSKNFILVDSIPNPTNHRLDYHDVKLLSNGHYLLLLNPIIEMDLSSKVEGGQTDAHVVVNLLIETDRTGQIYWQWNILDHIEITDITDYFDLTNNSIDLTHINSIWEDKDGNIVISIRHFDEVAKINKQTGDFIWRLGGTKSKKNQFKYTNDTVNGFFGFSHQHSVTELPNGNILMFDNGNLKPTPYSRAVEYSLDTANKTVTKVWEYRYTPDIYQPVMGSAFRMSNGNTLINWSTLAITEVRPDKTKSLEIKFNKSNVYRVTKALASLEFVSHEVTQTGEYSFNNNGNKTDASVVVNSLNGTGTLELQKYYYAPYTCTFNDSSFTEILPYRWVFTTNTISQLSGKMVLNTDFLQSKYDPSKVTIYKRDKETEGIFSKLTTNYNKDTKEIWANFSGFGEFVLVSNKLSKPTLLNPANKTVADQSGSFEWDSLKGAYQYQIQADILGNFINPAINAVTLDRYNKFNYVGFVKLDSCFWRVRGFNDKDTSAWSVANRFTTILPIPKMLSPVKDSVNVPLATDLLWLESESAKSYNIQISKSSTFDKILIQKNVTVNILNLTNLEYNTKYYWRVQAVRSLDSSKWSESYNFNTIMIAPALQLPTNQKLSVEANAKLSWEYDIVDIGYGIQVSKSGNFDDLVLDTVVLNNKFLVFQELQPNMKYYWRVKAIDKNKQSNWTDFWYFTTGKGFDLAKPVLVSPAKNAEIYVVGLMKWTKISNAIQYHIQIIMNEGTAKIVVDTTIEGINEFKYSNLAYNSKYNWRVKAKSLYSESKWSDLWDLRTLPKSNTVMLLNPKIDQLQVNVNGVLEWYDVAETDRYIVQISEYADFGNLVVNNSDVKSNHFDYINLKPKTQYYWRVRYLFGSDSSKWSDVWYFTTIANKQLAKPKLMNPSESDIATFVNCEFKWLSVPDADNYIISISLSDNFGSLIFKNTEITDTTYKYEGLNYNQRYFWRISAINKDAQSEWSETESFLTELEPNIIMYPEINSIIKPKKVKISWNILDSTDYYSLNLASDSIFTMDFKEYNNILVNEFSVDLAPEKQYYCRIKSFATDNQSNWSSLTTFFTDIESDVTETNDITRIVLFPNPCTDYLYLYGINQDSKFYEIFNLAGSLVQSGFIHGKSINSKYLSRGTYFVKIQNSMYYFVKL